MCDTSVPQHPAALRILNAADVLMAKEGVDYLSTHKIAKAAGLSVGTIYLHFKDKDDLLNRLVNYLFLRFEQAIAQQHNTELSPFEQYRNLWWAMWHFMRANPNVVLNMHQYEALPHFKWLIMQHSTCEQSFWQQFVKQAKQGGALVDLPANVLFALSLKTGWHLMYVELISQAPYSDAMLEEIILRTWKAISL